MVLAFGAIIFGLLFLMVHLSNSIFRPSNPFERGTPFTEPRKKVFDLGLK